MTGGSGSDYIWLGYKNFISSDPMTMLAKFSVMHGDASFAFREFGMPKR